jgi:hypothetical protein
VAAVLPPDSLNVRRMPMTRRSERGEGKLANFIWLLIIAEMVWAAAKAGPIYYAHYDFKDKVTEICRMPRGTKTDEQILDMLMKEVRERQLGAYIERPAWKIQTRDESRTIRVDYVRPIEWAPGLKRPKTFTMNVDQPLVW